MIYVIFLMESMISTKDTLKFRKYDTIYNAVNHVSIKKIT
jgi:hypothetical protein